MPSMILTVFLLSWRMPTGCCCLYLMLKQQLVVSVHFLAFLHYMTVSIIIIINNNNNNPICKAPECQKTSVALYPDEPRFMLCSLITYSCSFATINVYHMISKNIFYFDICYSYLPLKSGGVITVI